MACIPTYGQLFRSRSRNRRGERDTGSLGAQPERRDQVCQQVRDIHRCHHQDQLARLCGRNQLQIFHQARGGASFLQRGRDVVVAGRVDTVENAFEIALDDVDGCAQFVGHVGREIAPLLVAALQFTGHAAEAPNRRARMAS